MNLLSPSSGSKMQEDVPMNVGNYIGVLRGIITQIIFLYMFRALLCSSSGGQIVLYSIWYCHTETSEWSKITKIQLYKYEHIVVKKIIRV